MIHADSHDATDVPILLFGAFDRHNFGDLLFPHIAAALLKGKRLWFAGLAERDLRSDGGHQVGAVAQLAAQWGERPVNILHVGGELLTCDAWEAAVMLLPPQQARETIAYFGARQQDRLDWARTILGITSLAPYTLPRALFPGAVNVIYNAVGGVNLRECHPALRAEVYHNLHVADTVSVRDSQTQALLGAAGIKAELLPDSAVMVAELFGTTIHQRSRQHAIASLLEAFPQGYVAVQFSADFGDDDTLAEIAAQLDRMAADSGHGIVFFRAGAAPWHDDLMCYQRVAARMRTSSLRTFTSINLWDICALIACCRVYCGSSLHGRIVAMAFARPRINLVHSTQAAQPVKQAAFAATWEAAGMPITVEVRKIAQGIGDALAADPKQLQRTAKELAISYRRGFNAICAARNYKN
jgi:hypothetical protein